MQPRFVTRTKTFRNSVFREKTDVPRVSPLSVYGHLITATSLNRFFSSVFFFNIIGLAAALLPYKLFLRRRLVLDRLPPARARIYFATPRADFPLLSPKITLYGGKYRTERLFPAHYRYYYYFY